MSNRTWFEEELDRVKNTPEYKKAVGDLFREDFEDLVRRDQEQRTRQADIEVMCRHCGKDYEHFKSGRLWHHTTPHNEDLICGAGPIWDLMVKDE